jgi:hypothetical protein
VITNPAPPIEQSDVAPGGEVGDVADIGVDALWCAFGREPRRQVGDLLGGVVVLEREVERQLSGKVATRGAVLEGGREFGAFDDDPYSHQLLVCAGRSGSGCCQRGEAASGGKHGLSVMMVPPARFMASSFERATCQPS